MFAVFDIRFGVGEFAFAAFWRLACHESSLITVFHGTITLIALQMMIFVIDASNTRADLILRPSFTSVDRAGSPELNTVLTSIRFFYSTLNSLDFVL